MGGSTLLQAIRSPRTNSGGAAYPHQLVLDWTDYCNAKCFFCYRDKYEKQIGGKGEFIPFAKLKKLEKVLSKVKIFGISSGIGEPLLHPELEEILSWLYRINPAVLIRTTTNGTPLTAQKAAWFAGHIDWLSVSLNAANGEAHMRDMFPHLEKRGIEPEQRWALHLRHLREFIAALPAEDRPRVRFQMVAHRYNVHDIPDFVRVIHGMGGSHAVITNIAAHSDTIDWSLYWVKDTYNDCVDEACEVGVQLGVKVDAVRFYTSVKPVLNLDQVCHEPDQNAYISRSSVGAPCCQWTEAGIPTNVYDDEFGFDRYWNHEILGRLREKRDFKSCQVCGMSRVFDETSFHFSPHLKKDLIESGKLSQMDGDDDYPDARLVRVCVDNRLDLPSIRRTLLALKLSPEMAGAIQTEGLGALPSLEQACWESFKNADQPPSASRIEFAGPFLGIGWGTPIHEPQNGKSARWIGNAQAASIFVRVPDGTQAIKIIIHHLDPPTVESTLKLLVNGEPVRTRVERAWDGRLTLSSTLPEHMIHDHGGRLWLKLSCTKLQSHPLNLSVSTLISGTEAQIFEALRGHNNEIDLVSQLQSRVEQLQCELQQLRGSRSWRLTAPLRKVKIWLHGRS